MARLISPTNICLAILKDKIGKSKECDIMIQEDKNTLIQMYGVSRESGSKMYVSKIGNHYNLTVHFKQSKPIMRVSVTEADYSEIVRSINERIMTLQEISQGSEEGVSFFNTISNI